MEHFEKWYHQDEWTEIDDLQNGPPNAKGFAEAGYREALKWVTHKMNIIYAGDMATHTLGPIIRKELLGE